MIAMPALERIIVSGARPDAQLLLYDLQLDAVGTIALAEGLDNTGHLLAVDDTRFLGWYAVDDETTALYLYDLQNDKLVKRVTLAGPVGPIFHRPVDNSFWVLRGTELGRLDPETLTVSAVAQLDRRPNLPLWIDHTLYGRGGGELVHVSASLP